MDTDIDTRYARKGTQGTTQAMHASDFQGLVRGITKRTTGWTLRHILALLSTHRRAMAQPEVRSTENKDVLWVENGVRLCVRP